MLQQIREVSPKFYQLALFNIGLIIAISKELSPLHIASSLVFIILLVAPIALYFNILQLDNAKVIHEAIQEKVSKLCTFSLSFVKTWSELEQSKQIRYITNALLSLYLSVNLFCPCIETFLIFNAAFIYFFLQEEVERIQHMIGNMCSGCCPLAK